MKKMTLLNRILAVVLSLAFMLSMPGMSAIAEAVDNSKSESKDLKDFLSAVTITDADGNPIGKTLADGENYKIRLEFSEKGAQSIQLSTEGTLTYQIPTQFKIEDHSDKPLNIKIKGSDGSEEEVPIGKYSVDENGLLTVKLNEEGKNKLAEMNNATLSFDMDATADVTHGSSSGSVDFGDVGEDFTFEITDQPRVKIEKDGVYTENADKRTGGALSYTVKVTVEHGDLYDATLNDVLILPQHSAFSLNGPKNGVIVKLKRNGDSEEHRLTPDVDYELTETKVDTDNPLGKAFQIKIKEGSDYYPLKEGDELRFTYTYDVNVSNRNLHLWANMQNIATFTGNMPVKDPGDPNKAQNIPVTEEATDSCEVFMSPDGHGVICKDQSYSEATKTLHYTLYTVVPKGAWTPLQIYDDMYVQYNGKKWYLKEFKTDDEFTPNGKVKNLTVKAVDVNKWFGGDDWADNTPASDKIKSFSELAKDAEVLTGYSYDGWNVPDEYNDASRDNYLYYFADKSLYIIFGEPGEVWGEWGSWNYDKDRLIITEYDLDMSSTEPMTLYDIDDEGTTKEELQLTPEKVLKAGITNNVALRYGGYFPGYSVFFNNADDMIKTGELNKADGTIDYTVTINTTDSTVKNYFHDVATKWYELGGEYGWDFDKMFSGSMQAVFYDKLPEGWEYVDGSLYAVACGQNNKQEFHKINCNRQLYDKDNNIICVPLTVFQDDTGVNDNTELDNWFIGSEMTSLEFHYQLKASDDWKKNNATANNPVPVKNHAEIKDKTTTHWSADKTLEYYPAKLTKKAIQVDGNSDLLEFTLAINPEGADLDPNSETLNVVDKSENLEIVKSSITVTNTNTKKKLVNVPVKTETVEAADGSGEKLQLTIVVPDGVPLDITYEARIPKKGVGIQVSNSAGIEGVAQSDDGYSSLLNVDHINQSGSGSAFGMTIKKVDADTEAPLAGATFKLYIELKEGSVLEKDTSNPIQGYSVSYIGDYTTGEDGTADIVSNILGPDNWYFLVETEAPEGYEKLDKPIRYYYGLRDDTVSEEDIVVNPYGTLEVTNTPALGSLTVEKVVTGNGGDTEKDFTFAVEFGENVELVRGKTFDVETNHKYLIDGEEAPVTEVNVPESGKIEGIILKNGEHYTIKGLPAGVSYKVTETEDPDYLTSYSTTNDGSNVTVGDKTFGTAVSDNSCGSGIINIDDSSTVTVTNTRKTGDLAVEKIVKGDGGDKNKAFNFTVTLDDKTITGTYGDMTFENGVAEFTLKHNESKTALGLPAGIGYTVTETEANQCHYTTESTGSTGTIPEEGTAQVTFTNTRGAGNLEVKKTVVGVGADATKGFNFTVTLDEPLNGTYGEMTFTNGAANFTLTNGEVKKATDLPEGIGYSVLEKSIGSDYSAKYSGEIGKIEADNTAEVEVTNTRKSGSLSIKKVVDGEGGDKTKEFTFTITFSGKGLDAVKSKEFECGNGTKVKVNDEGKIVGVKLKDGETFTVTGLPTGLSYTVTEAEANKNNYETTYSMTTDKKDGNLVAGLVQKGVNSGTVEGDTAVTVTFTNTFKTGDLVVTKSVAGTDAETDRDFHFTVSLSDTTINGTYGAMNFTDGVAKFDLKHGESATAKDLPAGVAYTVTEERDGEYAATFTGETGKIEYKETATAAFTNTRKTGGLTVTKAVSVSDNNRDENASFEFTVKLGKALTGDYGQMHFENGVATFTLKDGESKTASGLPTGITYEVAEKNYDKYVTTYSMTTVTKEDSGLKNFEKEVTQNGVNSGTVDEDATVTIAFTNTFKTGGLTVTKTVTGNGADLEKLFHFTVSLSDTTINGDYGDMHFTNGVADLYLSNNDGTATATDLPVGVKYTVIEDRDGEYSSTFTDEIGEIEYDKTATAAFTNTRKTGGLTVTKVVEGKGGDLNKEFHFTVTLENKTVNGTYGEMEFENGAAAFTLKSGESKTATGLPTGLGYTVKESEENQDNYVTVYTLTTVVKDDYGAGMAFEREVTLTGVSSGVIAEDDSAKVTVTNTFKTGGLEIEKVVTLNGEEDPSDETEFTFTLKLDNEKINGEYGEYADDESTEHKKIAFTNGEATFTLKHGQRVIFSDLPDGTVYTLTEVNNPNYLETSATTGTIRCCADGRIDTLTVTNVRKTGGLEIEKVVTLNGEKDESDKTEFGFTLTLDNSEISGEYGDVKFENGIASFTLKQGETVKIDGIPSGTGYTLAEDPNSDYREAGKISGVINHNTDKKPDKLTVTNIKATGDLTVKKTVDGGGEEAAKKTFTFTVTADGVNVPDGKYGDIEFKNGSAAVTITGNGTATAKGLPIGTYKVTENSEERDIAEWKLEVSPEGGTAEAEVVNRGETTVEIVNKYTKSTRYVPSVKKTVENEPEEKKVFTFELKDASGAVIDTVEATGSQTVSFGSISYDKEGAYVYTITEVDPHAANDQLVDYYEYDSSVWTLTVTVTRNADTGELEAAAKYAKGSTTSDAYAEFVNKYVPVGSFSVTKAVKGVETDASFSIKVTAVGNSALSGTYGDMTFVDGAATFTLENGQTVTANGVPTGTYTVEEDTSTAAVSGYRLSVESKTHETVAVGVGGDAAVEIVNSYEPNPGTLVVKKTVTGSGNPDAEFNFTVTLSDVSVNGDRGEMTFKDGVATFTLKSGESKAASNLPAGTNYTVVETEANTGDYVTSYNGVAGAENAAGTIETERVSNVEVRNHRPEGNLSIEKKVVGGGDAGAKQDYSFEVTGPENYKNTVTVTGNGKQELKGLVPGTYTITEASADIENYTLKVTTGEGEAAVEGSSVTVEVSADETAKAEVIFTNTYTSALGSLTIKKTVEGGGAEAANKVFTFTVTGPSYPEGHDVTITGSGTATLESLIPGTYTVTEKGGDAKGYDLEVTGDGEAEITADKVTEIDVTNTYTQKLGGLKLTKTVVGGGEEAAAKTYTFKVTGPNGYSKEVEVNGNGSETLTDLVPGVYTVTEVRDGTEVNGYDLAVTGENDVTVEAEKTAEITITNTYTQKLGKLTVVKSLVGGGDEARAKTYTFTVTGPNSYSDTVTITGSGTATLEDLVPGVYTVSEENAAIEGYSLEVTGGGNATVEAEKTATVAVVNTYKPELGSLTITKVVVGGGKEAANKAYTFTVSGPNGYSDTVTIIGNGAATLDSLVPGAYTVTEENAGITGYTWAVSGDNGVTVESNKTATVTVVNTYEPMLGSLTIRKVVNAPVTEPTPDPAIAPDEIAADAVIPAVPAYFNVRVAGADDNTGGYDVVYSVPANGSITIEGLVPGLYTVTEVDAGVPGLAWSATGSGDVTVVGGSGTEVTITNNYTIPSPEVGTLIISKAIFGAEEKALNKTFVFDVTGSNGYTNTVTVTGAGSAVLTDLEPAVYTVTERKADIEGYTWSVSVSGEGNVTVGGTAEVTVTNSYTELPKGALTVNKTVIGGGEEAENKVYTFNVTGPNGYSNTVTVTGTGSVTITDLEPGTYTVIEVREGAEIEGYTLSVTDGGTAVVGYGTASDVNVTNNYTENPKGSLRITKTVTGDTEAAEGKVFIFDIAGPEGYTNTVTVAAGGSVTVSDLKPGTYTVTERSGEIEGYTLEVTGEGDYPVGTEEVEAAINNNYTEIPKGSLTVTKTVTGDTEAAEGKVFIFDIAGPDGYTDAVTVAAGESVTIADLEPGAYTVTEQSGEIEGYTLEVTGEGDYTVGAEEISIEIVNNYTEILKGSLVINKEVVGGGEEAANKTYTFDVTGPEGYSTTVTVTGSGSAVLTDLTPGEYTITEQNAEIEGCTLEVTGSGTVTVEGNESAEITVTNTYTETPKGSLVISKELVGGGSEASEKTYTFEVTGPNGYSAEVTVIGNGSATLNNLEPGIYTVSEKDAAIEGYTLEVTGEGETAVIANENAAVTVTNTYEQIVGSMTITKSVVGGGDEAANKTYTFVITGPNDYSNTVTVIGSGSVTVEGLVPGEYTVTEQNAEIEGYRLTVDGTETATVVADENVDVTITNSYDLIVGSLTITKSVVGGPEDAASREYTFLVTGPDGYAETVTVTGNGSATLEGLVPGEYTVTEQNAEIEGYSLTVDGEGTVTVIADQNIDTTITNNYELLLGSLTLTKAIAGGGERAANRIYTFVVTGPEGYSNTVNIIGSGNVTLTDLIPGEYIVAEQNAEISGYRWNVSGEGAVTVIGGEGVQLTVANTYDELRDINVYKEWYVNGSRTSAPYGAQITVVLLADGEATGDLLILSEANNWSGAFTGLLVNAEDGHEIVYTVAEVYYAGWTSSVSGSADAGFVITNYTATPEIPNIPNVPDNPYIPPTTPENPDVPYFPNNTFDIPDFDTPLSDILDAEIPLTDIPDLDAPLDAFPATGDESRTYLWAAVMLFSGLGIIVLIAMLIAEGRKSKENSESAE